MQGPTHEHDVRDGLTWEVKSLDLGVIENLSSNDEGSYIPVYVMAITDDPCGSDQPSLVFRAASVVTRSTVTAVTDRSRVDRSN